MFWNSVKTAAMVAVGVLLLSGSAVVTYHAVTGRRTAEERGKDERVGTAGRTNASRLAQSGGGLTVDRPSVARASNPAQSAAVKHPPVATAIKPEAAVSRAENDPLARIATEAEFEALAGQVMLIADDAERLQAIRQRLGMKISDEVYRKALEAHGNGNRVGNKLFKAILGTWADTDPEASLLWAQRLPETMKATMK